MRSLSQLITDVFSSQYPFIVRVHADADHLLLLQAAMQRAARDRQTRVKMFINGGQHRQHDGVLVCDDARAARNGKPQVRVTLRKLPSPVAFRVVVAAVKQLMDLSG